MLGLAKKDWKMVTENLSNQANKFGLVPKPPVRVVGCGIVEAGGGQQTWTRALRGEIPLVYRPYAGKNQKN
jgi:hypothetical protein